MPSQNPQKYVFSITTWRQNNPEKARALRERELVQRKAKRRAKREEAERQRAAQGPATEKQCSVCGVPQPFAAFNKKARSKDGYRPECRKCQAEFHAKNKTKAQARNQRRKDEIATYNAKYHQENRDDILARHSRNRLKNLERDTANNAHYRRTHPEYFREAARRRRAQEAGAPVNDLSVAQWREVLEHFQYRCVYCPANCKACKNKTHELTQDHITPIIRQGSHTLWNVVPACRHHNNKKHANGPLKPVQPLLLTIAPTRKIRTKKGA